MKKLAASFFITGGIIAFILLALGIQVASESRRSGFVIFLYFLIGAIFALMIFFAIGYTLNRIDDISENVRRIADRSPRGTQATPSAPYSPAAQHPPVGQYPPAGQHSPVTPPPNAPAAQAPIAAPEAGKIVCPKCGKTQLANRRVCFSCGTSFLKPPEEN